MEVQSGSGFVKMKMVGLRFLFAQIIGQLHNTLVSHTRQVEEACPQFNVTQSHILQG